MAGELVVEGILFPEGLGWAGHDGTMLVSSVQEGVVYRVWPEAGRKERLADVGGGANNLAVAEGGGCVVCQNGGVDAGPPMAARYPDMALPPVRTAVPGLMAVAADGATSYILRDGVNAPNDVTVGADGSLYFTDPGNPFLEPRATPRVMRYSSDGELSVFATGFDYCNGIFPDGDELLVTDHGGVLRLGADGEREWLIRYDDGNVDGLTVDADGRLYVARQAVGGVDVVEDGKVVDFLDMPDSMITNACFGGPELSWLFATDARHGSVIVWTDLQVRGRPLAGWVP